MFDPTNTFTTEEGAVFDMAGATCPACGAPSELKQRHGFSGYFNCPVCGTMYDEPAFGENAYVTDLTDDDSTT